MLIDDDADDRELFVSALQKIPGHPDHDTAVHGLDGLTKLSTSDTRPGIIFLDLNMPMMNGIEFLKEIKNKPALRDIPVVVFTTTANPGTIEEVRGLGAYKFFTKPIRFEHLGRLLHLLLEDSVSDFVVR